MTTLDDLNGLMRTMMKTALERMLNTEMDVHLHGRGATEPSHAPAPSGPSTGAPSTAPKNRHNGHSKKTVGRDMGAFTLKTPRDRNGTFEPPSIAQEACGGARPRAQGATVHRASGARGAEVHDRDRRP
ncbi:transposase mutator type : TRm3 transposase OS=Sulfitobacter sp. EE-36 GN=EE36_00855 PE=4 SV=1: Transposase_mut [Gemmata massiliana]|uniref:Mutator family transposase n=1 Tax=Gemmata massiliana TaxID=1210884 RepID=A0A6P2CU90_9BACT|nr:transposase [Gemmata massiliana]VTR92551.1 transposase mutator type : TRm3 transposase OS=Sulfitobacter sp. EE-36 GN=EE36_00855 PE=4 SV=1: Transposase_mut [Gemmata massiliana]